MAVTVRENKLTRTVMFLCTGAAVILLAVQWRAWFRRSPQAAQQSPPGLQDKVDRTPVNLPTQLLANSATDATVVGPKPPARSQSQSVPSKIAAMLTSLGEQLQQPRRGSTASVNTKATTNPALPLEKAPRIVVDLSDRQVFLYRGDQLLTTYPVAVGQKGWETPTGSFKVIHRRMNPEWKHPITGEVIQSGADNPLGTRWIGFWSDGRSEVGFHGTNQVELIGQAVSHGCLRMHNQDVEALYQQVSEGTPVIVRP